MHHFRRLALALAMGLLFSYGAAAQSRQPEEVQTIGEGSATLNDDPAAAEDEAIWDAKRNAVENTVGVLVHGRASGRNAALEEDEIHGHTDGFVRTWAVVPGSRRIETVGNGRILHIRIAATIGLLPLIRRLSDIADIYKDFERPRTRIEVSGDEPGDRIRNTLIAGFRAKNFEVAESGPAEILLQCSLKIVPTLHLGDSHTPFALGETVAACNAVLSARVISTVSQEVLFSATGEGAGQSFISDAAAGLVAAGTAATALFRQNDALFVEHLLVRWARERQDGYEVAIKVSELNAEGAAELEAALRDIRGFRRIVSETHDHGGAELHFLTRLDLPSLRLRIASLYLNSRPIKLLNDRGPLILCAAAPSQHVRGHKKGTVQ